jgi:hypothetical protein
LTVGVLDSRSRKPPFLNGFLQNIAGIEILFDELLTKHDIDWLGTRYLSQDFIETVYSQTRALCGHNSHPNPAQFRPAIRNVMVQQVSKTSKSANCEFELIDNIVTPEEFDLAENQQRMQIRSFEADDNTECAPYLVFGEFQIGIVQMGIVKYVTGFAIRGIKHETCKDKLVEKNETVENDPTNYYIIARKYTESSSLIVPNTTAFTLGLNVNKIFCENYEKFLSQSRQNVRGRLECLVRYDTEMKKLCCTRCFQILVRRLFNSFINGRIRKANEARNVPKKRSVTGRVQSKARPTAVNQKARKLNIN